MIRRLLMPALIAGLMMAGCTVIGFDTPYNKGVDAFERGDFSEAIEQFRMATEKDNRFYEAWYNLARSHDELTRVYRQRAEALPSGSDKDMLLTQATESQRKADVAYREALAIQPNAGRVRVSYAMFCDDVGRVDEARANLEQAVAAETDRAYPLTALGYFEHKHGRLREAKAAYELALLREPGDSMTLYRLGRWHEETGNTAQALEKYEAATQSNPKDHQAWWHLAELAAKEKRPIVAAAAYERFLRLVTTRGASPRQQAEILMKMASLYMDAGWNERCVRVLWDARVLSPGNLEISKMLERAYSRLQREELARLLSKGQSPPDASSPATPGGDSRTSASTSESPR